MLDSLSALGILSHAPGHLRYFGINIVQGDDLSSSVDSGDKRSYLSSMGIPGV